MPPRKPPTEKRVTQYSYEQVKEPRTPETGHTALMPADEQVVTLPMDNGWTKAVKVGKLPAGDERPVIVDMDPAADPVLFWAGKRSKREIPVLPLQRNEIVSESRIAQIIERAREAAAKKSGADRQGHLFADLEKTLRDGDKDRRVEFYVHDENWKNKLICGDSLQVMESLLHYEHLRGKVQMIYMDPPYGIKYDSNFQQRIDTTKNDEKDAGDDVLTIKAFRDTWALGVHSYLSYLQERLYMCRELLSESGSVFVQISDQNIHIVRALLGEVFGESNFVAQISFLKTSSQSSDYLSSHTDFLLWYAKDRNNLKYQQLYREKELGGEGAAQYTFIELASGERRKLTIEELDGTSPLPSGGRVFSHDNLCSTRQGRAHEIWSIDFEGKEYWPTGASTWKTNKDGIEILKKQRRLMAVGNTLRYLRYLDDFRAFPITAAWTDTGISGFVGDKFYAVQTSPKVIARCIAMTTAPGDLVLDITCGGGTTAACAELTARRWITCDTSCVAINVARKRLLSTTFPHYLMRGARVSDGIRYRELSRITMGSLTSGHEPEKVELVDQPEVDKSAVRVCGPFEVMTLGRYAVEDWKGFMVRDGGIEGPKLENYISVICRLYRKDAAVQGAAGLIHAVAESGSERIGISVGPLTGRVTAKQISDAVQDGLASGLLEVHVLGWAFEANVGEIKSQLEKRGKIKVHLEMIRPDTLAEGLKVTNPAQLFSPLALPDVTVTVTPHPALSPKGRGDTAGKGRGKSVEGRSEGSQVTVTLDGVGVFERRKRTTDYHRADSGYVAAWYLDEDYDGDCFVDCQMFFDFGKTPNLKAALKAEVDPEEYKLQLVSQPFPVRKYKRVAVKVVDVYGNESTVVKEIG